DKLNIQNFKQYFAYLCEKCAIKEDPYHSLIQKTKNIKTARQLRFESLEENKNRKEEIKWYIEEAIRLEKSGEEVPMKTTETYHMTEELKKKLEASPALKEACNHLTPGRQSQYIYYIGDAKKASTRQNRVEKYIEHILEGKGMNDD